MTFALIFPRSRIDSYGIEVSQQRVWLILGIVLLPVVIGLIFLIIWMKSKKLVFMVNTISKERLEVELKTTNTDNVEEFIKFLNQNMLTL